MSNYIGITIGPIFDMMRLVSTPAALWATSYMFSMISKKTCEKLYGEGIKIISPFYDSPENELFNKNDGIGLFHDRIIIEKSEKATLEKINKIKRVVLKEVSKAFALEEDELEKRVLLIAVEIETEEGENPILKGGKILDSLELSRKVMFAETGNPILEKFTGAALSDSDKNDKRLSKNRQVKDTAKKIIDENKWSLLKEDGDIKDLSDIAESVKDSGLKKHNYYAIVRSDGDNMSKIIERLNVTAVNTDENGNTLTLSDFSKICLEYCSAVAEFVKEYKGVPVYSSGDDLLAIMPCDSGEKGTVFDFVKDVNRKFNEMFKPFIEMIEKENEEKNADKKIAVPSLSFGISVCYSNFPLYEALDVSAELLFDIAKSKKNCTAVRLQKHSGQSEGLLIYNDTLDDFISVQNVVLGKQEETDGDNKKEIPVSDILLSALYKTEQFSKLFLEVKEKEQIDNLFVNTFDGPEHGDNDFVHKKLPEFYFKIRANKRILALSENGFEEDKNDIIVFNFAMRMLKFYVEKSEKKANKSTEKKGEENDG